MDVPRQALGRSGDSGGPSRSVPNKPCRTASGQGPPAQPARPIRAGRVRIQAWSPGGSGRLQRHVGGDLPPARCGWCGLHGEGVHFHEGDRPAIVLPPASPPSPPGLKGGRGGGTPKPGNASGTDRHQKLSPVRPKEGQEPPHGEGHYRRTTPPRAHEIASTSDKPAPQGLSIS